MLTPDADFTHLGVAYRIGKLDAFSQFHVSRRIAPILVAMGTEVFKMVLKNKTGGLHSDIDMALIAGPVSEVVARLSDEDSEYVLDKCLSVVKRQAGEHWCPVRSNGLMMYQDVDMMVMLRLVVEVVRVNLGPFFPKALAAANSQESPEQPVEIQ